MIINNTSMSKSSVFKMFSIHTKTKTGIFKFHRFKECFRKVPFSKCFHPHTNQKQAFLNSTGLKSVFEKLRFRDGLVWTVGQTLQTKLRFQTRPAKCARWLIY